MWHESCRSGGGIWSRLPGAEPECMGHDAARFDLAVQREHVAAFLVGDGGLVLGKSRGDFLQGQVVLADVDEVVQQRARSPLSRPPSLISSP